MGTMRQYQRQNKHLPRRWHLFTKVMKTHQFPNRL